MAILNVIAANNWERPIYIDHSLLYANSIFFLDYLQFEGLAYRFVPIETKGGGMNRGRIDADILYENVMKKFKWGNVNSPNIYLDEYNKKAVNIIQARYMFARLAQALVDKNDNKRAVEVLDKMFEIFPDNKMPLTYDSFPAVEIYYRAGETEKANKLVQTLSKNSFEMLEYYLSLPDRLAAGIEEEQNREISLINNLVVITDRYKQDALNKEIDSKLNTLIKGLEKQMGS
jgi:tetratricopeptide (TPR) repeat protein